MELLERYLQAVKKLLPRRRQDDIIAELRANMESQIEDKESELGRPLTEGEFEDMLRKMGPPVVVASQYQPQRYLIGPTLFPLYTYVLRIGLLWAYLVYIVVFAIVLPLAMNEGCDVIGASLRFLPILFQVAGWITLVFAAIEFTSARYPQMCPPIEGITKKWHPQSLPPLEKDPSRLGKSRSFAQAIAEIFFSTLFLGWLLLIPKHPFLILGPGAAFLQDGPFALAPVWRTFFWCVVAFNIFQIVWKSIDLARGTWQFPNRVQQYVFKVFGLLPFMILLGTHDHIYVFLRNPAADQLRYGQTLDQVNKSIQLGVAVVCAIVLLQIFFVLSKLVQDKRHRRDAARQLSQQSRG